MRKRQLVIKYLYVEKFMPLFVKQLLIKHKPGVVQKTNYILADKLPYDKRNNRHCPIKGYDYKDKRIKSKVNNITCTRTEPDIGIYKDIMLEVPFLF